MKPLKLFTQILAIFALMSCQTMKSSDPYDSPQSTIPTGSMIELLQTLDFVPGFSRAFIQSGQPRTYAEVDQRLPYCQFYRYEPPSALQTLRILQPDLFKVITSSQTMELGTTGVSIFASIGSNSRRNRDKDDYLLSSVLKLSSDLQPEIVELKCAVLDESDHWNFLSVNQIKATLGELVTITLPDQ